MGRQKTRIQDPRINKIGAHIKKLRVEKGYTSYESFAFDHDLPTIQYWRLETGANFTITSLLRILDIHKMTLKEFFDGIE